MAPLGFHDEAITQLTAAGDGDSIEIKARQPVSAEVEVVIASIDTDVTVKMEYASDSAFTSGIDGQSYTLTADGTYVFPVATHYNYARLVFVSENGGTGVTVDATYYLNLR